MDTILCQRCNSKKVIRIRSQSESTDNFYFTCEEKKIITKTLEDFGTHMMIDFCTCLDCGQHQGTFPKSDSFFDDIESSSEDEEWLTCRECGSQNVSSDRCKECLVVM